MNLGGIGIEINWIERNCMGIEEKIELELEKQLLKEWIGIENKYWKKFNWNWITGFAMNLNWYNWIDPSPDYVTLLQLLYRVVTI